MSGHSKWSTIKHHKGVVDARRGQLFTKLAREITVAARQGGPDPDSNFRLRLAMQKAKDSNMPSDNVDRAIKRGTGVAGQDVIEEVVYEGYSPGGAAILLEAVTDNPTRTVSEVRHVFTKCGGNMGDRGCVAWIFESRGVITLEPSHGQGEEIALLAIDVGAEDFELEENLLEIRTLPQSLEEVRKGLDIEGISLLSAGIEMLPKNTVGLRDSEATQTLRLLDRLEDLDDVQRVFTNADFPDDVVEEYNKKV